MPLSPMVMISCLKQLHLLNFLDLKILFDERFDLVYGENGYGKTAFLESDSFFFEVKSFRTSSVNSMINKNYNC